MNKKIIIWVMFAMCIANDYMIAMRQEKRFDRASQQLLSLAQDELNYCKKDLLESWKKKKIKPDRALSGSSSRDAINGRIESLKQGIRISLTSIFGSLIAYYLTSSGPIAAFCGSMGVGWILADMVNKAREPFTQEKTGEYEFWYKWHQHLGESAAKAELRVQNIQLVIVAQRIYPLFKSNLLKAAHNNQFTDIVLEFAN